MPYWRRALIPCIAVTLACILSLLIPATNPMPRFIIIFMIFVLLTLIRPSDIPKLSFLSFFFGWCYFIVFSVLVNSILVTALANTSFLNSSSLVNRTFRSILNALCCGGKNKNKKTEADVRIEFANICDNGHHFLLSYP